MTLTQYDRTDKFFELFQLCVFLLLAVAAVSARPQDEAVVRRTVRRRVVAPTPSSQVIYYIFHVLFYLIYLIYF